MAGDKQQLARILVVEDDMQVATMICEALRFDGHEPRQCDRGSTALDMMRAWQPDLVLLDLGLPDGDGSTVAREIRSSSDVPLMMVTGRAGVTDRVGGLEMGADDYMVKPFSVAELVSRVHALLRRSAPHGSWSHHRLAEGPLVMDLEQQRVFLAGIELELSNKEFAVLRMLMERPGKVVRRSELARQIWGGSADETRKTIDVHLSWLRNKLGDDPKRPRYIETVRGVGFRLLPPG